MIETLTSKLLRDAGFQHGFSTRQGGVSEGAFASLNLGRVIGDDDEAVRENAKRFAASIGADISSLFEVSQVHGKAVVEVEPGSEVMSIRKLEADALVSRAGGGSVGVRTADCVPVLIADVSTRAVAACHAGWRGAVAEVVPQALSTMGSKPGDLIAAIGPHIRQGSFEIGEEVAVQIEAAAPGVTLIDRSRERPHADLASLVRHQLRRFGIAEERIEDLSVCTYLDADRCFSYRRDGGRTGRHLSAISPRR